MVTGAKVKAAVLTADAVAKIVGIVGVAAVTTAAVSSGSASSAEKSTGASHDANEIVVTGTRAAPLSNLASASASVAAGSLPSFCQNPWHDLGRAVSEIGSHTTDVSLVAAGVGAVTGVGAAGGLAVATIGGVVHGIGTGIHFFAGDATVVRRALVDRFTGGSVKKFVPKSLRNKLGDALSDTGVGKALEAGRSDPCGAFKFMTGIKEIWTVIAIACLGGVAASLHTATIYQITVAAGLATTVTFLLMIGYIDTYHLLAGLCGAGLCLGVAAQNLYGVGSILNISIGMLSGVLFLSAVIFAVRSALKKQRDAL